MTANELQRQIDSLEAECRAIERKIGNAFGEENRRLHALYRHKRRRIGALLLQRDRIERPHIYRKAKP